MKSDRMERDLKIAAETTGPWLAYEEGTYSSQSVGR